MNKNTYGRNKAAMNLVDLIAQHPNAKIIARKVGRILEHTNYAMNKLELLGDKSLTESLFNLVLKDVEENHLKFVTHQYLKTDHDELDLKIRSHIINILKGRYKAWKRGERNDIWRFEDISNGLYIMRSPSGKVHVSVSIGKSQTK